jgi:hypothetical protein
MFLIIAPLVSMYITAYMVTYKWYEQGKQIMCLSFGSRSELVQQDAESAIIFICQTTFVFTMNKIVIKIGGSKLGGLERANRVNKAMVAFFALFSMYMVVVAILKS